MKIQRYKIQACCGKSSLIMKLSKPLDKEILAYLVGLGFIEEKHFTKAGILYITNSKLILVGPFGKNTLQVNCKDMDCNQVINDFETLLSKLD